MEEIHTSHAGWCCFHVLRSCRCIVIMKNFLQQTFYLGFFARMTKGLLLCLFSRLPFFLFGLLQSLALLFCFLSGQKIFHIHKLQVFQFSLDHNLIHIFRIHYLHQIKSICCKKCGGIVVHNHMNALWHKPCTAAAVQAFHLYFQEMAICRVPPDILYPFYLRKIKFHTETVACKSALYMKCMLFAEASPKVIVDLTVHLILFPLTVYDLSKGNRHALLFKGHQGITTHIFIDKMQCPVHENLIICISNPELCHHIILMDQLRKL